MVQRGACCVQQYLLPSAVGDMLPLTTLFRLEAQTATPLHPSVVSTPVLFLNTLYT